MKIMNKLLIFIGLILMAGYSCAQSPNLKNSYIVAFYNMENLFDIYDDPLKQDDEFTPGSEKKWDEEKYKKKIADLSRVLASIKTEGFPVLVGVCEIENDRVMNDLRSSELLRPAGYDLIWHEGPDMRGIDCALLYQSKLFKPLRTKFFPVINPADTAFKTREIVYACGTLGKEIFHVFVNHWPSRRGGQEESMNDRALTARVLRSKIDSILSTESNPNIIIMGDMNDEPGDVSLSEVLKARPNQGNPQPGQLVNLMYDEFSRNEGSYNYRGNWDMIDNLIVSGNLITKKKGLKTTLDNGYVFHQPFMEYRNDQGEISPNRTFGKSYYGGISDHFPVYLILRK